MERELLLLGLLRRQEMHGYQLHDFIDRYLDMCVDLKKSTAYYLLDKIAKEGLVTQSEEREGNRPPRQVYRLTPDGEARFQELLRQNLVEYLPVHFGGLVGLAFLDEMEAAEARTLLNRRRQALVQAIEQIQATPPHPGSLQNVIEHQERYLAAELAWLDTVISRLGATNEITETN
jgi:DNA-binding PadR family transcriptional regulator